MLTTSNQTILTVLAWVNELYCGRIESLLSAWLTDQYRYRLRFPHPRLIQKSLHLLALMNSDSRKVLCADTIFNYQNCILFRFYNFFKVPDTRSSHHKLTNNICLICPLISTEYSHRQVLIYDDVIHYFSFPRNLIDPWHW